jgi:hypothetical protein
MGTDNVKPVSAVSRRSGRRRWLLWAWYLSVGLLWLQFYVLLLVYERLEMPEEAFWQSVAGWSVIYFVLPTAWALWLDEPWYRKADFALNSLLWLAGVWFGQFVVAFFWAFSGGFQGE